MTDNQIIKALERCYKHHHANCEVCPNEKTCEEIDVIDSVIALINRQKAEIERLQHHCFGIENELEAYKNIFNTAIDEAKSEAIKEFAEKLKEKTLTQKEEYIRVMEENHPIGSELWEFWHGKRTEAEQTLNRIEELVKIMTESEGGENA